MLLQILDIELLLKLVLASIMFTVGLSLKLADFKYVFQNSRIFLLGIILKMVILPFLILFAIEFTDLPVAFKFGIFIMLISPGGTTSNVITYWFKGTPALTITLTTITSFLAVFFIPILVNTINKFYFGASTDFSLSFLDTVLNILLIIIIPVFAGLAMKNYWPKFSQNLEKILKPFSVILLAIIFLIKFFASKENGGTEISMKEILQLFPILLIINIICILFGYYITKLFKFRMKDRMTIGIELGLQNVSLAILIGGVLLGNEEFVKPPLIYGMFTFWSTALFAFIIKKRHYEKNWT